MVWQTHAARALTATDLSERLQQADYVLLGETHDNQVQHQIELSVTQLLIDSGWLNQLSMEMLTPKQTANYYSAASPIIANERKAQLLWPEAGWPWDDYKAIISAALDKGLTVAAANIDRDEIMRAYKGENAGTIFSPAENQHRALAVTIEESHCGQITQDRVLPMVNIQLAKDQAMANSVLQQPSGVLLIAGAFHVRKDLSVPQHLQAIQGSQHPRKDLIVVAMQEEDPALASATAEELHRSRENQAKDLADQFDIIIFTPEQSREDPCTIFNIKTE